MQKAKVQFSDFEESGSSGIDHAEAEKRYRKIRFRDSFSVFIFVQPGYICSSTLCRPQNHKDRLCYICPYFGSVGLQHGAIRCSTINSFSQIFFFFFRHIEQQLSLAGGGMNFVESRTSIWTRNDSYSMIIWLTVLFGTSFTEFIS